MLFFRSILLLLLTPIFTCSQAVSDSNAVPIDIRRVQLHEDIDKMQQAVSTISTVKVDSLQRWLESNPNLDHRLKYKYLSGIKLLLEDLLAKKVSTDNAQTFMDAYQLLMQNDIEGISIESTIKKYPYEINRSLLSERTVFYENAGLSKAKLYLHQQYLALNPDQILTSLTGYLSENFVDDMLAKAARFYPSEFYNYASAIQTPLAKRMRLVKDTTVQILCRMSSDSSGRLLFPFLHALLSGEMQYDTVKKATLDGKIFYQLLVKTQIHYQDEISQGNPPVVSQEIFKLLKRKSSEVFINSINGMHDEPDLARFKILEGLNAQELYYLMVSSEDIIYTSSFVGIFKRMMEALKMKSTDELLHSIHFDGFRKFIKMAADYNKLDDFINAMKPSQAALLIKDFVAGLEIDPSLENAVDVANGFASITNVGLKKMVSSEIDRNFSMAINASNAFGVRIYEALQLLLRAEKDSGKSFAVKYHLSVPYFLPREKLIHDDKMIEQLFFYGDKDGRSSFDHFVNLYKHDKRWRIIKNEQWIEIKSIQGKRISIFANIPFDNTDGGDRDAAAQASLNAYLKEQGLTPAVVVHRGHSYHLPSTLAQLNENAKLVILGSCGSYQSLHSVLAVCEDVQIISSREVGSLSVNDPLIRSINEQIRIGKNIDWIRTWKNLEAQMKLANTRQRFDNYVAPHKNLGVLLLQALNNN